MTNPPGRQYEGFTYPTEIGSTGAGGGYTYGQGVTSTANPLGSGFGLANRGAASGLIRRTTPQSPATTATFGGGGGYNYFHQHTNSTGGHSAFGSESGSVTSSRAAAAAASAAAANSTGSGPALVSIHSTGPSDTPNRGAVAGGGGYRGGPGSVSSSGSHRMPGPFVQASPTSAAGGMQFMDYHAAPPAAVGVAAGQAQPSGPFYPSSGASSSLFETDASGGRGHGAVHYGSTSAEAGRSRQPFVQPPPGGAGVGDAGQGDASRRAPPNGGLFSRLFGSMLNEYDGSDGAVLNAGDAPRPVYQTRFGYPEDDLPLLDELGINPVSILREARVVLNPLGSAKVDPKDVSDLAGPLLFVVALAFFLSLHKKELQFNAIYSLCVAGLLFFKGLLSLMSAKGVSIIFVMSALGYSLLPNLFLAIIRTALSHPTALLVCGAVVALWSSWCATVLLVKGLEMQTQRYLILYPVFLFYAVFATLTIF